MANAAPDVQSCVVLPVVEAEREFSPFCVHWAATGEVERGNRIVADASHVWVYADGATQSASTIGGRERVKGGPRKSLADAASFCPLNPQLQTSAWRSDQLSALCQLLT
jgi:hypothetical protein